MFGFFILEKHIGSKSGRFYNEKHIGSKSGQFYCLININKIIKWHPEKKEWAIALQDIREHPEKNELAIALQDIIEHPVNCGVAKGQRRRILVSIRITGHAPMSI